MGRVTTSTAPGYLRATALRGLPELVAELGGDPDAVLREAGLDRQMLRDATLVPATRIDRALEVAADQVGSPGIALLLAGRQDASILGPLSVCLESAPTVGEALACTSRYLYVHAPDSTIRYVPAGHRRMDIVLGSRGGALAPGLWLAPELSLGLTHRVLSLVCGGDYGLAETRLVRPPAGGRQLAEDFFTAPVRTGCEHNALRVPASLASRPLASRNPLVHRMAIEYLEAHGSLAGSGLAARVHDIVISSLGTSAPLVSSVAGVLGMHHRTLQRRLAEEGTSYATIVDEARRETAWRLVTETDLPLARVARLVGLADQSVLTRTCRRWFGAAPSQLRRR